MKTNVEVLVVLGCVSAVVAAGSWADDRFDEGPRQQPKLSDPVPSGSLTESEAKRELDSARLDLNTALQYHGNISPEARLAVDRVQKAQAAYDLARREKEHAAVPGGTGKSGGALANAESR